MYFLKVLHLQSLFLSVSERIEKNLSGQNRITFVIWGEHFVRLLLRSAEVAISSSPELLATSILGPFERFPALHYSRDYFSANPARLARALHFNASMNL